MGSVVVGFDGSEQSRRALERAAALAGEREVVVVTAVPFAPLAMKGPSAVVDPLEAEERGRILQEARARLAELGTKARAVEAHGDPADAIVSIATEAEADLVLVGSRGRHAMAALLLGSVSSKVAADAPCDVLVVH